MEFYIKHLLSWTRTKNKLKTHKSDFTYIFVFYEQERAKGRKPRNTYVVLTGNHLSLDGVATPVRKGALRFGLARNNWKRWRRKRSSIHDIIAQKQRLKEQKQENSCKTKNQMNNTVLIKTQDDKLQREIYWERFRECFLSA